MQRCLLLAGKGFGTVAPNPMVGCLLVHEGKVIGEGYHKKLGEAHAEVNAIGSVREPELLEKATLYVNLEPCSHYGKTPPCANLIIEKKIPQVVIGSFDPNPSVNGKGIQKLKEYGVKVITDVLKPEADYLNRRFLTFHRKQRPYIILKWAESAEGFIAPVEPTQLWLTNEMAKKLSHKWRAEEQAILVGTATAEIDDCELTTRYWEGKNPLRILIDKELTVSHSKKIFNHKATSIVFNTKQSTQQGNIEFVQINFDAENVLTLLLAELHKRNVQSLIVEGGAYTLQKFIAQNLWDEARYFISPISIANGKSAPVLHTNNFEEKVLDDNILRTIHNPLG